jgi:beta-xylosidase
MSSTVSRQTAGRVRAGAFGRAAAGLCALAASLAVLGSSGAGAATFVLPIPVAPVTLPDPGVVVTPGHGVPDPFVFEVAGVYFMFASQENFFGANLPVMVSTSLTSWAPSDIDALPTLPSWAGRGFTWSPDVREIDGHYVMWFSAALASAPFDGIKCIGVATATSVIGPYVSTAPSPLVCQLAHLGSIDPRTFLDPQGHLWLVWKSDDNADTTGTTHTTIFSQQLAPNGLSLIGHPIALMTANLPWEGRIVESPDMVFAGGRYWLFYSGNWFNQPTYAIGVAQCAGPAGPCEPSTLGPWFGSNAEGSGPGEESLFFDGSRWWMFYAPFAVNHEQSTPRPAAMARLTFGPDGPTVVAPDTAAWAAAPDPPSTASVASACTRGQFRATCDVGDKRPKGQQSGPDR